MSIQRKGDVREIWTFARQIHSLTYFGDNRFTMLERPEYPHRGLAIIEANDEAEDRQQARTLSQE
jgi:hypothetical protein